MGGIFRNTGSLNPRHSVFNLSYEKKLTCDMGQLIPVMCDEMVPGDFWKLGNQAIVRFQPLVAPVLHEINMYVHYFFVPYRLLWDQWEDFITGGVDGSLTLTLPRWTPIVYTEGSLWDYLGFPPSVMPTGALPMDFPRRAYNLIYNEYYRDETLTTEVLATNETILTRAWEKDYFTSSLPWQQRGTAPALPISGTTNAVWQASSLFNAAPAGGPINFASGSADSHGYLASSISQSNALSFLNGNSIDLSSATTFDVSDLRLAFQIQKWLERNARAGARYTEFLRAHFGISPRDERLQRPEYIGGSKAGVIVSEVLQTSQTSTTPLGTQGGHGMSISNAYCGKYHATEFGLIMGIMSIMPRTAYQQGINRQWQRQTKYDFYFPEFANLSEQAILKSEVLAKDSDSMYNTATFGYQGRYDEMRYKPNMVCAQMRSTYKYWHLGRIFDPATPPALNDSFIKCVPRKDIFAVPSEPGLIVSFGNVIKAFRPLPLSAEPGLIDHN